MFNKLEKAATEEDFQNNWNHLEGKCREKGGKPGNSFLNYMVGTWYHRRREWAYAWKKKKIPGRI